MSGIKRFFAAEKPAGQSNKQMKNDDVVDLLSSDSEIEMIDITPASNVNPAKRRQAATTTSEPKSIPSKLRRSASEILNSIKSPDLPETGDIQPNFRQVMQRQDHESGLTFDAEPNCLTGLTFVVTGELPTLGREEIQSVIKRFGGKVTSSLSGRTSCLVLGTNAGPAKIEKARALKLKVLSEDGFIELLKSLPAEGGDSPTALAARAKRQREEKQIEQESKRLKAEFPPKSSFSASLSSDVSAAHPKLGGAAATKSNRTYSPNDELWTTKYAPKSMADMVGNQTAIRKLKIWLERWADSRAGRKSEGSDFRAAMLSGPPGIGKTTAAHLMGKLTGYDVVEYNASDTRSKSLLQNNVAKTLSNRTLSTLSSAQPKHRTRPLMVIMDEVDGMSAGDRGGVGAMAALARTSRVPLVLICNERTLPKMRPFDRCVFDIPFRRPDASQVRQRLMSIAKTEGLQLDANAVEQLTQATRSDIRQILNLLATFSTTKSEMTYDKSRDFSKQWNKELVLKPFDIAARLLSRGAQNSMSVAEKMELYFHDYDFAPLMVQENYLSTCDNLQSALMAADSISDGDLVDRMIHGPQQMWSLMPVHALTSCVRSSYYAAGSTRSRFNFTSFLGNNSKGGKYRRLLAELRSHVRLKLSTNAQDLRLEMQPLLAFLLLSPLLKKGADAISPVIEFMDNYFITKEDWDVVMELGVGPNNTEDMAKQLPTAVKSAFTRKYNQMTHHLPFMKSADSKSAAATGRKAEVPDNDEVIADDVDPEEMETVDEVESLDDAMKNDKYIKAKSKPRTTKPAAKKPAAKRAPAKRATKAKNTSLGLTDFKLTE